jgi:hypothetical protein
MCAGLKNGMMGRAVRKWAAKEIGGRFISVTSTVGSKPAARKENRRE